MADINITVASDLSPAAKLPSIPGQGHGTTAEKVWTIFFLDGVILDEAGHRLNDASARKVFVRPGLTSDTAGIRLVDQPNRFSPLAVWRMTPWCHSTP